MASYATLVALKADLGIGDDSDDSALQLALDAATRFIDQYTGRSFVAEPGATRTFIAANPDELILAPDATAITEVAVDTRGDLSYATTLVADTDYYAWPFRSVPDAGIISSLRILPTSSRGFVPGYRVRVVGDWGYTVGGEPPPSIELACLRQAARWFKRREAVFGVLQTVDLGQFTRLTREDPDVAALLAPYTVARQSPHWLVV